MSDSDGALPTLEQQVDDLRAVLAAVGSERTAIIGGSDLGLSALFAATYPEQVTGLVLSGVAAEGHDNLGGSRELLLDAIERNWGDGTLVSLFAPSQVDNREFVEWWGRMQRSAVTPGMARKLMDMTMQTNLRDVLPTIRVPTIVVHARGDRMVPVHRGREVAALIPGARFIEREGDDAYGWLDPTWLTDVEEFLTGRRSAPAPDRVLATVLFTDIVDSTSELSASASAPACTRARVRGAGFEHGQGPGGGLRSAFRRSRRPRPARRAGPVAPLRARALRQLLFQIHARQPRRGIGELGEGR